MTDLAKIDLNLLVVFNDLLETRSVTQTGQTLGMSQPAVSYALARLRKTFNDPLFIRIRNRMHPTPRASALAVSTRGILERVRTELLQFVDFDPKTTDKTFTLGMSDVGEMIFLPKLFRQVSEDAPGAGVRTVTLDPDSLAAAMEAGEVDLALGYFPDLQRAGFYQQQISVSGFMCIGRADNPHMKDRLTLPRFLKAPHVSIRAAGRSQEIIEKHFKTAKIQRRIALTLPHFLSLIEILPQTDLIATVPTRVAESLARNAALKVQPLPVKSPTFAVKQFWHRRFHQDPGNRWVRGVVRGLFQGK